jgi:hypothetical protein
MSLPHVRKATLTIAHGELFAHVPTPIPGHLALTYDGPGLIVPVPAGVTDSAVGDMSGKELRDYLAHGMSFTGVLTLRDVGDGLRVVGGQNLTPITEPDAADHLILGGIMSAAEQLAGYRDARLKAGVEVTIEDWQGPEREDKTTPDNIHLTIQAEDQRLLITTRDGRKLDLELQDGVLRAMAYESEDGKEAPVITGIPPRGEIETDREDYDREFRPNLDGPGF